MGTWVLRLWSHGTPEGSDIATSGILTVPVPTTADCTFQADVSVVRSGGIRSYYSGTRATVPDCGPLPTLAGDIYLCTVSGGTTTEVADGTLKAMGPETLASQPNPLAPTPVLSGTYIMTAGSPPGYVFVACGGSATIGSTGTTATESLVVYKGDTGFSPLADNVTGGAGVGIFYVTPAAKPLGAGSFTSTGVSSQASAQTSPATAAASSTGGAENGTVPVAATAVGSSALAFTGLNTGPLLLVGLLALALGTLCIAASRVRRRPTLAPSATPRHGC
jgi:hypothetical protein